jgi:hypothetical protein
MPGVDGFGSTVPFACWATFNLSFESQKLWKQGNEFH